jgi:hypothetical protein
MVSKCANPNCKTPFRYFREGKLFHIEAAKLAVNTNDKKPSHKFENFWLCAECASTLTVTVERKGIVIVPIRSALVRGASA